MDTAALRIAAGEEESSFDRATVTMFASTMGVSLCISPVTSLTSSLTCTVGRSGAATGRAGSGQGRRRPPQRPGWVPEPGTAAAARARAAWWSSTGSGGGTTAGNRHADERRTRCTPQGGPDGLRPHRQRRNKDEGQPANATRGALGNRDVVPWADGRRPRVDCQPLDERGGKNVGGGAGRPGVSLVAWTGPSSPSTTRRMGDRASTLLPKGRPGELPAGGNGVPAGAPVDSVADRRPQRNRAVIAAAGARHGASPTETCRSITN